MKTDAIKTGEPFESLFPVDSAVLAAIAKSMEEDGYDSAYPIIIWKERGVVVDGHARLLAARSVGIENVRTVSRPFETENEAVEYAIHCQCGRRNLNEADLVRWIAELDKRKTKAEAGKAGRDKQLGQGSGELCPESSAEKTAALVGTSATKVKKVRTILDHAPDKVREIGKPSNGGKSINRVYREVQEERERKPKPKKKSAKPRGLENWEKFRAAGDAVLEMLDTMETIQIDKDHQPEAKRLCEKISGKACGLAEHVMKG